MLRRMGVGKKKRLPLQGLEPVVRGGQEGCGVGPAVSFVFLNLRIDALKKWESNTLRHKRAGNAFRCVLSPSTGLWGWPADCSPSLSSKDDVPP